MMGYKHYPQRQVKTRLPPSSRTIKTSKLVAISPVRHRRCPPFSEDAVYPNSVICVTDLRHTARVIVADLLVGSGWGTE